MNINATLFGQAISFTLFVLFCMKYVWPPLIAAIEKRQQMIADGLASADKAAKSLELASARATDQLREAKAQASEIIEAANKRKSQIIDEAKDEAFAERAKILVQAEVEVETERRRLKEELRKQVAGLAIAGAEKIIERSIDAAANSDIVDKIVAEL